MDSVLSKLPSELRENEIIISARSQGLLISRPVLCLPPPSTRHYKVRKVNQPAGATNTNIVLDFTWTSSRTSCWVIIKLQTDFVTLSIYLPTTLSIYQSVWPQRDFFGLQWRSMSNSSEYPLKTIVATQADEQKGEVVVKAAHQLDFLLTFHGCWLPGVAKV